MPPLITTKLTPPQPGQALIARPELLARCLASAERSGTCIIAPAGFGKTTILMELAAAFQAQEWSIAWITLEESEQDVHRFWRYMLDALDRALPGSSLQARRWLFSPRPPPLEQLLTLLINDLAAASHPVVLLLDDYHRAATPAHDHALEFLLEHAPPQVHLVIASRTELALPLHRLRAQGRIGEFHAGDLRFALADAGRFLQESMHMVVSTTQLQTLMQQSEGWIAGLQLLALALRDQVAMGETLAVHAPPLRYITEYLVAEVVEHQSPDVQQFLWQTATLERLSGPLCDAVTGRTDCAAMLQRLMEAQLFVTPLDATHQWYRYHHLFAEALRTHLERFDPVALRACHQRAAGWMQAAGMVTEAIAHWLAAAEFGAAAALIAQEADRVMSQGEMHELSQWVQAIPHATVLDCPHLCVIYAIGLVFQGLSHQATTLLAELAEAPAFRADPERWGAEVAVVHAVVQLLASDFVGGAALARRALDRLAPNQLLLRSVALWCLNIVGIIGDEDLESIIQRMDHIARESLQTNNVLVAYITLMTRAGVELFQGRLHRVMQTCREALRIVTRSDGVELPITALAHCMMAEVWREWNALETAEATVHRALAIAFYPSNPEFIIDGLVTVALSLAERGQIDQAMNAFADIQHMIHTRYMAPLDLEQVRLAQMRAFIIAGHRAEVERWMSACLARRAQRGNAPSMPILGELEDLVLARAILLLGDPRQAIPLLEQLRDTAASTDRRRSVLEANIILTRAYVLAGQHDLARCTLLIALSAGAPEGYQRLFLDEGEHMADLLATVLVSPLPERTPSPGEISYVRQLLSAFGRSAPAPALGVPEPILSPREMDVLRLLATGRSNEAIAESLVVALSTVKWHVAHIYRKLGVKGRVRALARAHELHLLN